MKKASKQITGILNATKSSNHAWASIKENQEIKRKITGMLATRNCGRPLFVGLLCFWCSFFQFSCCFSFFLFACCIMFRLLASCFLACLHSCLLCCILTTWVLGSLAEGIKSSSSLAFLFYLPVFLKLHCLLSSILISFPSNFFVLCSHSSIFAIRQRRQNKQTKSLHKCLKPRTSGKR